MRIVIFGAGSIGCLLGGCLLAEGVDVTLIGREAINSEIKSNGLTVSDLEGRKSRLSADNIPYFTDPAAIKGHDVILLTVKCTDTRMAAQEIAKHADKQSIIYSLQNGVGNLAILEQELKDFAVISGMVAFNALWLKAGHVHRATDAGLVLGKHPASHQLAKLLRQSHVPTTISTDMESVLWGKLCLNLNNAINVLSDLPLKAQLEQSAYRRVLAICIEEALAVIGKKGIKPAKIGKISPRYIPTILNLPSPVFKVVASSMMKMDDTARSSMWEDLVKNREPEIDYLNGKIAEEGEKLMVATPANAKITQLVKDAFAQGRSPQLSGEALLEAVSATIA